MLFLTASAQIKDSTPVLKKVTVTAVRKPHPFTTVTPMQSLSGETLQQINASSVGDAARYFSGVLIKDYGGVGGLKTISVRSLGAANTAIIYDGIPVSDVQTGQIDLSRFSSTFVQSLQLHQANMQQSLQPARAYASSAALAINTNTFNVKTNAKRSWQSGIKAGSFGLWQPFAGFSLPVKNTVVSAQVEALFSRGDYPFDISNGNLSTKATRNNAATAAVQGEVNLLKQFADSSTWQTKIGGYTSERELPGAVVFFNDRSVQKLWNEDLFAQSRYRKRINEATSILVSAKYSQTFTRYADPDFLNNQGGLDSRYRQHETYVSIAASRCLSKDVMLSAASDLASAKLTANLNHFADPVRLSWWNNVSLNYARSGLQLNGSLLHSLVRDKTMTGTAAAERNELTPTLAASLKPSPVSPWLFRAFYKNIFRMPTFNDLYYNFIGNASLRPEYAKQYNAGVTYSNHFNTFFRQLSFSADGYINSIKDKIIAIPNKNLFVWTMLNLGKVNIKGLDITTEAAGTVLNNVSWFCRIAYTWQQALDVTDPSGTSYKNRIPYTPDHSGSGLVTFHVKSWGSGYSMLFSGARYTLGENNPYNQLNGWLTHDVFVSRSLKFKVYNIHIKGELSNISDKHFDIVRYFPMPGRSFKISLLFNNL